MSSVSGGYVIDGMYSQMGYQVVVLCISIVFGTKMQLEISYKLVHILWILTTYIEMIILANEK